MCSTPNHKLEIRVTDGMIAKPNINTGCCALLVVLGLFCLKIMMKITVKSFIFL